MQVKFSGLRLWAIILKEFIQIVRDRPTLSMMVGIPLMQTILFGYAINTNPRNLPTAIVSADHSSYTQDILASMQNTRYFRYTAPYATEKEAETLLKKGEALFVVSIPPNFTRDLVRGQRPAILIEADGTDPVSTVNALATINNLTFNTIERDSKGALNYLRISEPAFNFQVHAKYNPLAITQYNIVPGLLGVVLTMTMVIITALAMTRERERGTLENLLATPVLPIEVIIGKILPYIIIGYIQVFLILLAGHYIFSVPVAGSVILLLLACLPFIAANLAMGLTFSTLAKNQLQAVQSAMFFVLPSLLLSGFMFPFKGMPTPAQWLGNLLPLTHFVVIARGILLKGNGLIEILPQVLAIIAFTIVVVLIGLKRFRRTLD